MKLALRFYYLSLFMKVSTLFNNNMKNYGRFWSYFSAIGKNTVRPVPLRSVT